jgi:teichoic acid transport system ATP-binding protein
MAVAEGDRPAIVVSRLNVVYRALGAQSGLASADRRGPWFGLGGRLRRARATARRTVEASCDVPALRDVSLVVRRGESVGVIGLNGAGKTTLVRAVAGLVPAASGAVYAAAEPVLLGVRPALSAGLTGEENLKLGATAVGLTAAEVQSRLADMIAFSGLGEAIFWPLKAYSSGMYARLAFTIATAVEPEILLLDEALATGDAEFRQRSRRRLREIQDRAGTMVIASHALPAVRASCTRCVWLREGRLIADGSPDEVCDAYEQYVGFLEASNGPHSEQR